MTEGMRRLGLRRRRRFSCRILRTCRTIDRRRVPIRSRRCCFCCRLRRRRERRRSPTSRASARRSWRSFDIFDVSTTAPFARPVGQHPSQSRPGGVPALFCGVGGALTKTSAEVIAIDGKTVAALLPEEGGRRGRSMSSRPSQRADAWCRTYQGRDKSNEIVAVPALLEPLASRRSGDDRRCGLPAQNTQTIIDKKADYILALKDNQGTLRDDVVDPKGAEGGRIQEYVRQPGHHRRRRPRPHRDPDGHCFPRHRLAAGQQPMAGPEVVVMVERERELMARRKPRRASPSPR